MTTAHIVNTLIFVVPCFALIFLTFLDKAKKPDIIKIAIAILIFMCISFYGSDTYDHYMEVPVKFLVIVLVVLFIAAIIFSLTIRYQLRHSMYIVAVAKCYSDQVLFLAVYVYFLIHGRLPSYTTFEALPYSIGVLICTFPFIYLFFKKILRRALDYSYDFPVWKVMWIVPICSNVLYTLLFSPEISGYTQTPTEVFYYAPPIWVILTFATHVITLWVAIVTSENATILEKYHISENLLLFQQKQAENLQSQIEQTSRMRHDMRHHILILETYIKNKNWDELEDYAQKYKESLPKTTEAYCKNMMVNSLIGYYKEKAENANTRFDVIVDLADDFIIPDIDLCSVLANLLENAIEACERMKSENRHIKFRISSQSNSVLAIIVENSYEDEIKRSGETFISSKAKNRKGIGISSVENIVEQYNGIAKFEYQDHVFKASVLMRIS